MTQHDIEKYNTQGMRSKGNTRKTTVGTEKLKEMEQQQYEDRIQEYQDVVNKHRKYVDNELKKYEIKGLNQAELDWLSGELSDWLQLPIEKK